MTIDWDYVGTFLTGKSFVVIISLFYIAAKLFIRHLIHNLINHKYDGWAVIAWSWVDISVLTLSLCLSSNVPGKLQLSQNGVALWYIGLGICIFLSILFYGFFIKRKNETKGKPPYKDIRMGFYLSSISVLGLAYFLPTMVAVTK